MRRLDGAFDWYCCCCAERTTTAGSIVGDWYVVSGLKKRYSVIRVIGGRRPHPKLILKHEPNTGCKHGTIVCETAVIYKQSPINHEKHLVQRATAVQLQAAALSVRVFYQPASTVPLGYPLGISTSAINQTMPVAPIRVSYVLRTQPQEFEPESRILSTTTNCRLLSYRFPTPINLRTFHASNVSSTDRSSTDPNLPL